MKCLNYNNYFMTGVSKTFPVENLKSWQNKFDPSSYFERLLYFNDGFMWCCDALVWD